MKFTCSGNFDEIIDELGEMPLPPYIHEKPVDPGRYQTVYARGTGFSSCADCRAAFYAGIDAGTTGERHRNELSYPPCGAGNLPAR